MRIARLAWVLGIAVLLAGCVGQTADIQGDWTLVSLNGSAPLEGSDISIGFDGSQLAGSGGCNQYGGRYTLAGDQLRLEDLVQTEMACLEESVTDQEIAYMSMLMQVDRAQVQQGRLTLSGRDVEIVFQQAQN